MSKINHAPRPVHDEEQGLVSEERTEKVGIMPGRRLINIFVVWLYSPTEDSVLPESYRGHHQQVLVCTGCLQYSTLSPPSLSWQVEPDSWHAMLTAPTQPNLICHRGIDQRLEATLGFYESYKSLQFKNFYSMKIFDNLDRSSAWDLSRPPQTWSEDPAKPN